MLKIDNLSTNTHLVILSVTLPNKVIRVVGDNDYE